MKFTIDNLLNDVKEIKLKKAAPAAKSDKISKEQTEKVISKFDEMQKIGNPAKAAVVLMVALQCGAVSSRKGNKFLKKIDEHTITSEDVTLAVHTGCTKDTTSRAFARANGKLIFDISKMQDVPGNLVIIFERNYSKEWDAIKDADKKYWASDFQGSTPECPEDIRALINKQYTEKFKSNK